MVGFMALGMALVPGKRLFLRHSESTYIIVVPDENRAIGLQIQAGVLKMISLRRGDALAEYGGEHCESNASPVLAYATFIIWIEYSKQTMAGKRCKLNKS